MIRWELIHVACVCIKIHFDYFDSIIVTLQITVDEWDEEKMVVVVVMIFW